MRLGIVGCGQIASWHGRAAAATKAVELVACCDQRHGLAEQYAKEYGCERSYAELDEMLAGGQELDAVLLATWPMNHRDAIIKCLDQGIRLILCEKSLTCDPEDAYEVWEAAARTGAKIVEGLMWRHHPAIQTVDGLIASGRLGKLDYIRAQFDFFVPEEAAADDPTRNWRHQAELGGGVPWDVTCYCVDACARFAVSMPTRVSAVARVSEKYGIVDSLDAWIEYDNGVIGMVASSLRSNHNYELQINGSSACVVVPNAWRIDDVSDVIVRHATGLFASDEEQIAVAAADPYHLQLERFVRYARGDGPSEPSLVQSVVNIHTIDAIVASGRTGRVQDVNIPPDIRHAFRQEVADLPTVPGA